MNLRSRFSQIKARSTWYLLDVIALVRETRTAQGSSHARGKTRACYHYSSLTRRFHSESGEVFEGPRCPRKNAATRPFLFSALHDSGSDLLHGAIDFS